MILDTSAVVAILRGETDGPLLAGLVVDAPVVRMSAATYVELAVVIDRLGDPVMSSGLDTFMSWSNVIIQPLTAAQAHIARTAYQRFGTWSGHPARLNMGDCFAYALARDLGETLLFKGDDFTLTDIEIVIEPIRERRLSEIVASYAAAAT